MTGSDVVLDAWAWWEILHQTPAGRALERRYVRPKATKPYCSAVGLAELVAKLNGQGRANDADELQRMLKDHAHLVMVDESIARRAGRLRPELRRADPDAGIVDAIHLATARDLGVPLISADRAFSGQPDVRTS